MIAHGNHNPAHDAGRDNWAAPVLMIAGALSIALLSYSVSMKVSGERAAVERLARENGALEQELSRLEAERRVRARLPQLERWNSGVLGLKPIEAGQFLHDPLQLADYGTAPVAAPQGPELAVMRDAPRVGAPLAAAPALRTVAARVEAAAPRPAPKIVASSEPAGIDPDLVAAVEALAAAPPARRPALTTIGLEQGAALRPPGLP